MHGILLYAIGFENGACEYARMCLWVRVAALCAKRFISIVANNDVPTLTLTIYYFLCEMAHSHANNLIRRVIPFFSLSVSSAYIICYDC